MSALTFLQARVERYLVERRRLGFSDHSQTYALRSFARHVQAVSHRGPLTVEVMADWARRDSHGSTDPRTWARRLNCCNQRKNERNSFRRRAQVSGLLLPWLSRRAQSAMTSTVNGPRWLTA